MELVSDTNMDHTLGQKRLGVFLVSLVQHVLHRTSDDVPLTELASGKCSIYLHATVDTFPYLRFSLIGFQYSLLHQYSTKNTNFNPDFPKCRNKRHELPTKLADRVMMYEPDDLARLLVMEDCVSDLFPPTVYFGSPEDLLIPKKAEYFNKWWNRHLLPIPPAQTSCNCYPSELQMSTLHSIKYHLNRVKEEETAKGVDMTKIKDWNYVTGILPLELALKVKIKDPAVSDEDELSAPINPSCLSCNLWGNYESTSLRVQSRHPQPPIEVLSYP